MSDDNTDVENEEESTDKEAPQEDPWEKLTVIMRGIVQEELKSWRPPADKSSSKNSTKPETKTDQESDRKTKPKKSGFLGDFF